MSENLIRLISGIKGNQKSIQIDLSQFLVIVNQQETSLKETHAFIALQAYEILQDQYDKISNWRLLQDQKLALLAQASKKWVQKYRRIRNKSEADLKSIYQKEKQFEKKLGNEGDGVEGKGKVELLRELSNKYSPYLIKQNKFLLSESQIMQFKQILKQLAARQFSQNSFFQSQQSQNLIIQIAQQLQFKMQTEDHANRCQQLLTRFKQKINLVKKKLKQIYNVYCKQNKIGGQTFEQYTKASGLLDIRLYLKYFKDFQYQVINKYRYRSSTLTQHFRNNAQNTISLNFQQFWNIHKQLFGFRDPEELSQKKSIGEIQDQLQQLSELHQIISSQKAKVVLHFSSKTQTSPQILKSPSMRASKLTLSSSVSRQYQSQPPSERSESILRKNFIQKVREQVSASERQTMKKNSGSQSIQKIVLSQKPAVSLVLPKLLRISNDEINSQNIKKSLKKFAYYDFIVQEQKLKSIIGFEGQDEYVKAFFTKQQRIKQQISMKQRMEREIRKRRLADEVSKNGKHCHRYNPEEIQPYMRF